MRVIAVAQDFGFGPITMLNRAVALLPADIQVDFYIPKHLSNVLDSRPNTTVTTIDSYSEITFLNLEKYQAALITCDYEIAKLLLKKIRKVVVFDMLFWFWPQLHSEIMEDILVIAQNFIGVEERAAKYKTVKVVGPLLPFKYFTPDLIRERKGVLINLGGFKSPHHGKREASIYLSIINPLLMHFRESEFKMCIAGGNLILDVIHEQFPILIPHVQQLKHGIIRERMFEANMIFTVPGLGSIYESFFSGTPTYYLPPTNYTQALQIKKILLNVPKCFAYDSSEILDRLVGQSDEERLHR